MWLYQKPWKAASAKGRRIQGNAVLEISSGRSSVAGAWAQQFSAGFGCQLARQEVITGQTTSTSSLGMGQGTCCHSGNVGDGREVTVLGEEKGMGEDAVLWESIKAVGKVVRIWDSWWGGGVEEEYRTQFHSKLGFINDAPLRTACFLTCKESVKCCLFFSLRLFSSLPCSFLYCHPMLWLWFSALSHNISTASLYFEVSSNQH